MKTEFELVLEGTLLAIAAEIRSLDDQVVRAQEIGDTATMMTLTQSLLDRRREHVSMQMALAAYRKGMGK